MKLLVNASTLGTRPTGLGVYSIHCIQEIANMLHCSQIAGSVSIAKLPVSIQSPASISIGSGRFSAIRRLLWMRRLRVEADTLTYSPTHHGLPNHGNQIITIHDLICLRFPAQHRPQYLFFRFGLPRLLKRCKAVFTVSETTRQDVAATYGYPADKIYVVPNGVDTRSFAPDASARPNRPFLLMVGARYSHKNVDEVLDRGTLWSRDYRLVVTSCGGDYKRLLQDKVVALGLQEHVTFKDYVTYDELIRLYQGCSALLYPSKWEGFGIPPLEALACGSPVIASDIPVHREVLGDAAFFVQLGDPGSWQRALAAISDKQQVDQCLQAAAGRLSHFTWERSAAALERSLLAVEPALAQLRKP